METKVTASQLDGCLHIGVMTNDGMVVKDYRLLRTNGIAEKVFIDKNSTKPFSWLANVLSVALDSIGDTRIGGKVRAEYTSSGGSIEVPNIVKRIPLNDTNTLLVEIHRKVWKNLLREQDCVCKWCGQPMVLDIDLNRIEMREKDLPKLEKDWHKIIINLPVGWEFTGVRVAGTNTIRYEEYVGETFNQFEFECPLLQHAIANEKYCTDDVEFWRRIAFDCLRGIRSVDADGKLIAEFPMEALGVIGRKLFDEYLYGEDLMEIRRVLREEPPSLPFYYEEECANASCRKMTPVTTEANSFFSA